MTVILLCSVQNFKMSWQMKWMLWIKQFWDLSPGGWFKIKVTSYQYRKSHCGDKTVLWPSYLHNGISYISKMTFLYWIRALADEYQRDFLYCSILHWLPAPQSSQPLHPWVAPRWHLEVDATCTEIINSKNFNHQYDKNLKNLKRQI